MKLNDVIKERIVAVLSCSGTFEKDGKSINYSNIKVLTVINKNGVDVAYADYKFKPDEIMTKYGCANFSELTDKFLNKIVLDAHYNKYGNCTELVFEMEV